MSTPEFDFPPLEPRRIFGTEVEVPSRGPTSPLPVGFNRSTALSFGTSVLDVTQRWQSRFDNEAPATSQELIDLAEGTTASFPPGISLAEAQRRLAWQRRQDYLAQFDTSLVGDVLGGIVPYSLDLVTLATLPVGGAAATAAIRAAATRNFGRFLSRSAVSGAQVGAASVPLEVGIQADTRGEVDTASVLATALAPVALGPLLLAPGYALARARGNPRALADAANSPVIPPEAVADAPAVAAEAPAPPVMTVPAPKKPAARLAETFADYQGGPNTWLRDFAAGAPAARAKAVALGIDPDAPPLRELVQDEAFLTALRSRRTPDNLAQLADAADRVQAQAATPDDVARLRFAGMLDEGDQLLPEFRASRDTLLAEGPEGVWAAQASAAGREAQALSVEAVAAEKATLQARNPQMRLLTTPDGPVGQLEARAAELKTRYAAAQARFETALSRARTVDPKRVDPLRVMEALDAARVQTAAPVPARDMPDVNPESSLVRGAEPVEDDVLRFARENGLDEAQVAEATQIADDVLRAVTACGSAA